MEKTHDVWGAWETENEERGIFSRCYVKGSTKQMPAAAAPDGDDVVVKHLHFQQDVSN